MFCAFRVMCVMFLCAEPHCCTELFLYYDEQSDPHSIHYPAVTNTGNKCGLTHR